MKDFQASARSIEVSSGIPPEISVLIPIFNSERYVRQAIESVLAQTLSDFEILALDDGSTDSSLSILREIELRDGRLRVWTRENRGIVASRNEMIHLSRGRYLAVMDNDDICRPERFERQKNFLDLHPEYVAVGSRSLVIDSEGMPIVETLNELTHEELDAAHISYPFESRMCNPSVMMRKSAVVDVGCYRKEYETAEDMDLFLRLAEIGKIANLPDILVHYRHHIRQASHDRFEEQRLAARRAVLAAQKRRGLPVDTNVPVRSSRPETVAEIHRKWAWWALSAGNISTARKHALLAAVRSPISFQSLKALACSIRGY